MQILIVPADVKDSRGGRVDRTGRFWGRDTPMVNADVSIIFSQSIYRAEDAGFQEDSASGYRFGTKGN